MHWYMHKRIYVIYIDKYLLRRLQIDPVKEQPDINEYNPTINQRTQAHTLSLACSLDSTLSVSHSPSSHPLSLFLADSPTHKYTLTRTQLS